MTYGASNRLRYTGRPEEEEAASAMQHSYLGCISN